MSHRVAAPLLAIPAGLIPGIVTAHGLANHPNGWIGRLFDAGQLLLVLAFLLLLILTLRDRSR